MTNEIMHIVHVHIIQMMDDEEQQFKSRNTATARIMEPP